ncbi:hypothetical protein GGH95_001215, partial [Coemansia sp. RSA 1836]
MLKAGKSARRATFLRSSGASLATRIAPRNARATAQMQPFFMRTNGYHDSTEYGCISPPQVKAEG